jgi:hypothetical protein
MSDVLEKAKQHFRTQIANKQDSFHVPEWDTTIYYKPINARQRDAIFKLANEGKYLEAMVENLILRALDEEGKPIFKAVHKVELMRHTDPDVITRIASQMGAIEDPDDDVGEKIDPKAS